MARTSVQNWYATETTSYVDVGTLTVDVTSSGDLTAPCYIVFRPRDASNREVWKPTTVTATNFTIADISERYLAGSAKASGQDHPIGTEVWSVPLSQNLDDLWDALEAHEAAANPHSGSASSTDLTNHADLTDAHGAVSAATANAIVRRDAAGRAKVVAPSANDDIALKSTVDAAIPVGGIILWSGSVASIPSAWALCDGTNGTPDLRGRFVVGAGDAYAVAATGGAETVALSEAELPSHSHGAGTLATGSSGSHGHNTATKPVSGVGTTDYIDATTALATDVTWSGVGDNAGAHTHAMSGSTGSVGSGSAHENRPPYYALAYIQRVS